MKRKDSSQTLDFDEVGMPGLLSVNVGLPRDVTWDDKTVLTAIWKSPVEGRQMVRKLNIVGRKELFYPYGKTDLQPPGERD